LIEVTLQQVRIRGGNALAVQGGRAVPGFVSRGRQRQAATAEVQTTQREVTRVFALRTAGQQLFFKHVLANDAQVHHAVHHQAWDVVITYAQDINRHVLSQGDQALSVQVDFDTAARQQFA
jgi:hypothetical protein